MTIQTMHDAEDLVYRSYMRAKENIPIDDDSKTRDISLTKRLLAMAGNPDLSGRHILVTGSKGKGSTSRLISTILKEAGFRVGLFTSPHLVDFTERIQVNEEQIPKEDFMMIMRDLETAVDTIERCLPPEKYLGPIGIALTAALIYFNMCKTDINVIECGRGGRCDDVNVLSNEFAVITPIMEEHIGLLGKTTLDIADHKLGIIKHPTKFVFVGRQNEEVMAYIQSETSSIIKKKFYFGQKLEALFKYMSPSGVTFDVHTNRSLYQNLTLPLLGAFQADNAAIAIKVCEEVVGGPLNRLLLKDAFRNANWPGRCEIVGQNPMVILDGAINATSAAYLGEVTKALGAKNVVSIISVPEDKDYIGVIDTCHRFSNHLIITEPEHSHKRFPKDAEEIAKKLNPQARFLAPYKEALSHARELEPDLIFVVGTQTFIGEVKRQT